MPAPSKLAIATEDLLLTALARMALVSVEDLAWLRERCTALASEDPDLAAVMVAVDAYIATLQER